MGRIAASTDLPTASLVTRPTVATRTRSGTGGSRAAGPDSEHEDAARVGRGAAGRVGVLMVAASWQRWGGVCSLGQRAGGRADRRLRGADRPRLRVPPAAGPVGACRELGAARWVVAGRPRRRPGAAALGADGTSPRARHRCRARRRPDWPPSPWGSPPSGPALSGVVVAPVLGGVTMQVWFFLPPAVLVVLAVGARGWARASAILLVLASPLVAALLLRARPLGRPAVVGGHVGDAVGAGGALPGPRGGQSAPAAAPAAAVEVVASASAR